MRCTTVAAFALLVASSLRASELNVDLDLSKSNIHWSLTGNVHTVHGTFRFKASRLKLDPVTGIMSGDLVVDAASGESGNHLRDSRMNREILQSDHFQEIKLAPKKLEGALNPSGNSAVRVIGDFEIHGGTHEMAIPMNVQISGATVSGTGSFSVPYVDWGMKNPSNFLFKVDKTVNVEIVAVGTITGGGN